MHHAIWTQSPIFPRALEPDAIAKVVNIAGAVDDEALQQGRALLQNAGLRLVWDPGARAPLSYLAAPDVQRLHEAQRALQHPDIDAILCARGGYGTMRLLDALSPIAHPTHAPWLVGYSDITALHLWLNAQGIVSIHGPMVASLAKYSNQGEQEIAQLLEMLRTGLPFSYHGLRPVHAGRTHGRLIGGNLSLLQAMSGTPWLPHLDGAILLIEEIGEPEYRVDRMLQSLALGQRARGLRGIVFGQFTACRGLEPRLLRDKLAHWTRVFDCPVVMDLPVGHGETNAPIMLGVDYLLDANDGTLTPMRNATSSTHAAAPEAPQTPQQPQKYTHSRSLIMRPDEQPIGAGPFPHPSTSPGALTLLLSDMLHQGACTGLQLVASVEGEVTHNISMGATAATHDAGIASITPHTRFDLASVTKAVCTAILAHQLLDEGVVHLDEGIPPILHPSGVTFAQLLSHRSGLPAWKRLYDDARKQPSAHLWLQTQLRALPLEQSPNISCVYSDPGYILLGWWIEHLTNTPLDRLFQERIAQPLGLHHTAYRRSPPRTDVRACYAATEFCPWRGRVLQGIVHDEHCQILGGVSGHAGLFSTATDVDRIARALLLNPNSLLSKAGVSRMWSRPETLCQGGYTLGWDTITATPSNAGSLMSKTHTVGHLGYAGTSLWIDRSRHIAITLLTNRVHPSRDQQLVRLYRPAIHDAVMKELSL